MIEMRSPCHAAVVWVCSPRVARPLSRRKAVGGRPMAAQYRYEGVNKFTLTVFFDSKLLQDAFIDAVGKFSAGKRKVSNIWRKQPVSVDKVSIQLVRGVLESCSRSTQVFLWQWR